VPKLLKLVLLSMTCAICLTWAFWPQCGAWAQAQQPLDADDDASRKLRLEFMKEFRAEFEVFRKARPADPLAAVDEPILRWSNPVRNFFSDGALFLWLNDQRPAALATVSIRGNGQVWLEAASLSPDALHCLRRGNDFWTPSKGSLVEQKLPDAPIPAATARMRLVQMRRLCERFAARTEPRDEQPCELRLLPQPIYRYGEDAAEIIDGALFAFAETTDPEALLLLEAFRPPNAEAAYWRFTLAKMTSRPVIARLDNKPVWSIPGYWTNPRSLNDAYHERQLGVYTPSTR
jgi:hypothetical protein